MNRKDCVNHLCLSANLPLTLAVGLTKSQPLTLAMGQDQATSRGATSCLQSKPAVPQQQCGHVLLILTSPQGTVPISQSQICR